MNIITKNLNEVAPVYCKYQGQFQAQPAFIELDCRGEGELIADYSAEIGNAVPMYYWHGLAVRWSIPSEATGDSLINLFQDAEFLSCCNQILDGFEEVWDGNNFVGKYTEEAQNAIEEAEGYISNCVEYVEVWDVDDWLFDSCHLSEHWSDQPIQEAVDSLEGYVESNTYIDGDIEEALIRQAKSLFEYQPERLSKTHVNELLSRNEITQADADEWRNEYTEEA